MAATAISEASKTSRKPRKRRQSSRRGKKNPSSDKRQRTLEAAWAKMIKSTYPTTTPFISPLCDKRNADQSDQQVLTSSSRFSGSSTTKGGAVLFNEDDSVNNDNIPYSPCNSESSSILENRPEYHRRISDDKSSFTTTTKSETDNSGDDEHDGDDHSDSGLEEQTSSISCDDHNIKQESPDSCSTTDHVSFPPTSSIQMEPENETSIDVLEEENENSIDFLKGEEELTEKDLELLTQGMEMAQDDDFADTDEAMEETIPENIDPQNPALLHSLRDLSSDETVRGSTQMHASMMTQTLTQCLSKMPPSSNPSSSRSIGMKIHERQYYKYFDKDFAVGGTYPYTYRKKDCWVTISQFVERDNVDCAKCEVVLLALKDTFVGPKMAEELAKDPEWISVNRSKDKVIWKQDGAIFAPLEKLGKAEDPGKKPRYTYKINLKQKNHGDGYNASFSIEDEEDKKEEPTKPKPIRPKMLDLYAGGGGAALGFALGGMIPKYAVDRTPEATTTLDLNKSHLLHQIDGHEEKLRTYCEDDDIFFEKCANKSRGYPQPDKVDHIHASPPCQGFSSANRNGGDADKKKKHNNTSFGFVKAIKFFEPTTASFENVPGMLNKDNISYPQRIVSDILKMKYQVRISISNAMNYGDPQNRLRMWMFVAHHSVMLPKVPPPVKRKLGMTEALHELNQIPPVKGNGRVYMEQNGKEIEVDDHSSDDTKLRKECDHLSQCLNNLARTVRCQRAIKRPGMDECITIRQRATLQSFPLTYKFCGSAFQKRQLIGNAVPVNYAKAMCQSFMQSYQD